MKLNRYVQKLYSRIYTMLKPVKNVARGPNVRFWNVRIANSYGRNSVFSRVEFKFIFSVVANRGVMFHTASI